jgi:NAD+ diphosphatase
MSMPRDFIPSVIPNDAQTSDAWWFIFSGYRLLVRISEDAASVPVAEKPAAIGVDAVRTLYLGALQGRPCYATEGTLRD